MLVEKNKCCGCGACYNICPKSAIIMEEDREGFLYPRVNSELCINCKLCEKVCPVLNKPICDFERTYACISKNEKQRLRSSSGGVFYEIASNVLESGGYVCGAAFDENNNVYHRIINSFEELDSLMRSKYVQSKIGTVFRDIKKLLDDEKIVLFVGTACQVNGLKLYLRKDYVNLITLDIICHGVPSPKIWNMYFKIASKACDDKYPIKNINFRDKEIGWTSYGMSFNLDEIKIFEPHNKNLYSKAFLTDLILRPSCYKCSSKGHNRSSDITLADFWGYNNFDIKLKHDNKGLSLLVVHTEKGQKILDNSENLLIEETKREALNNNKSYYQSCKKPKKRDKYMRVVNVDNFIETTNKYTKNRHYVRRIFRKMKRIIFSK